MKDIDNYLEKLNHTINSLQEEADFFMVMHVFKQVKLFQTELAKETPNHEVSIVPMNRLDGGLWICFDNSQEDMGEYFTRVDIPLQKGWKNIEASINFDLSVIIDLDMELDEFIDKFTTPDYQKKYLSYRLDEKLEEKPITRNHKI